jgi:5-methyltetrahydrofolate--homocysteine methyltransferase
MTEVGRRFTIGDYYVPEMLVAARAMKEALKILKPRLVADKVEPIGKVILGTVKGDLHDIGKNLVAMMMEGAGFQVIDLGTDVDENKFIEAVKKHQPQIVGFSALLTTTMPMMKTIMEAFKAAGVRDKVKVMIGGAPVTQSYADEIGADAFAPDAATAATRARELI